MPAPSSNTIACCPDGALRFCGLGIGVMYSAGRRRSMI